MLTVLRLFCVLRFVAAIQQVLTLGGRAGYRPVRTENAAFSLPAFINEMAIRTFVKPLTGVHRHLVLLLVSAIGTGNN
jgi:hypothetical protein